MDEERIPCCPISMETQRERIRISGEDFCRQICGERKRITLEHLMATVLVNRLFGKCNSAKSYTTSRIAHFLKTTR